MICSNCRDREVEYGSHNSNDASDDSDAEGVKFGKTAQVPTFRLQIAGCDVGLDIKSKLSAQQEKDWGNMNIADHSTPLLPGSPITTKYFAVEYKARADSHGMSIKAQNDILEMLTGLIPQVNFPTHHTKNGTFVSDVNKYIGEDHNTLIFGTCPRGCTAFVGENSTMQQCPVCQSDRFTPCGNKSCKLSVNGVCKHLKNRTQKDDIYFRPLTCTLYRLLRKKGFLKSLAYKIHKPSQSAKYQYMDTSDGSVYKESMEEMEQVFRAKEAAEKWPPNSRISVPIILSLFYDGAQIYQTKWSNFSPLLVGIQNLPPTHRSVIGIGIFLCSLFTGKKDSNSERFLFDQCLREELRTLASGIELEVNGVLYFLQVRLKLCILDTKGIEAFFHVECCNSLHGCPWCGFHGLYSGKTKLNRCVYCGHRKYLPLTHYFRSFGNSRKCCPPDYYPNDEEFTMPKAQRRNINRRRMQKMFAQKRAPDRYDNASVRRIDTGDNFAPCDKAVNAAALRDFINQLDVGYDFYHKEEDIRLEKTFEDHMHFQHCDYRPQVNWCRRPNEACINWAQEAEQRGYSIMGFKQTWEMSQLPHTRFEDVVEWENMHPKSNVAKNTILEMKGERGKKTAGVRSFCEYTDTHHPYMHGNGSDIPPYVFSEHQQLWIDACVDCLLISTGFSEHFNIKNIFEHTGKLRSADKIKLVRVLLNYMCYCAANALRCLCLEAKPPKAVVDKHKPYRQYYKMLSEDFCEMDAPFFSDEELEVLHMKIIETVCAHEGMFPASESLITYHQLIHFAKFVRKWGPLNGWSAMSYERVIHTIKKGVPHGGANAKKTAFNRYASHEQEQTNQGYDCNPGEAFMTRLQYHLYNPNVTRTTQLGTTLCHDPFGIFLSKRVPAPALCCLNNFERANLVLMLADATVRFCGGNLQDAFERSPLCRLFIAFESHTKGKASLVVGTCEFIEFLQEVHLIRAGISRNLRKIRNVARFQEFIVSHANTTLDAAGKCRQIRYSDIIVCSPLYRDMNVTCYNEAMIYGINIKAVGCHYREIQPAEQFKRYGQAPEEAQYKPTNPLNNLRERWAQASHSSWLRYKLLAGDDKDILYGQFNFAFRLHLPGDPILHNTAIASVVSRKPDKKMLALHRVAAILLKTSDNEPLYNLHHNVYFVPIVQCFSTSLLVGGLDHMLRPINVHSKRLSAKGAAKCSNVGVNNIDQLVLLELHPERRKLQFDVDAFRNGEYNDKSRDCDKSSNN